MMKPRLLTPGPTPVPEDSLLELAKPVFNHRSQQAKQLLTEVHDLLRYVYCTRNPVAILTASGTGGMEAAVASSFAEGDKVICLVSGRWGERWKHLCKAFGLDPVVVSVPYGQAVAPAQLAHVLDQHPDAAGVCATLSETSTGVLNDIEAFGKIVGPTDAVFLVDAISGLGATECRTDAWQIDLCVAGSQKALMLPPGLAFVAVSDKALARMEKNTRARAFYFDLKKYRAKILDADTPWTPAITLIRALLVSLKKLYAEGNEKVWARHARMAEAARAGFLGLGLELFATRPVNGLTVARVPAGIDGNALLSKVEKQFGLKIANGQDELKGKIIRLAHMGYIDQFEVLAAISALELVLRDMGHPVEPGTAVAAVQRAFAAACVPAAKAGT